MVEAKALCHNKLTAAQRRFLPSNPLSNIKLSGGFKAPPSLRCCHSYKQHHDNMHNYEHKKGERLHGGEQAFPISLFTASDLICIRNIVTRGFGLWILSTAKSTKLVDREGRFNAYNHWAPLSIRKN